MLFVGNPETMQRGVISYHVLDDAAVKRWNSMVPGTTITSASTYAGDSFLPAEDDPVDAVTRLGDIFRNLPRRRPLSPREKHRRRRRSWLAKMSRRRNRR